MANTGSSSLPEGRQEPENNNEGLSPQVLAAIQSAITAALAAQATQQQIGAQQAGAVAQPAAVTADAPDPTLALENYYRKLKSELEGSIPKLPGAAQGGIYRAWAITIQRLLRRRQGLLEVITGVDPRPAGDENDPRVVEWEIKDTAGVEILLASMTEERKTRIPPTHTAAQIWALLKANGTAYTMESLHATLGELMRISYEPSEEDAEAFYMRVTALADQLNEAENRYGTKIYEVTPAMLLSVIGNALPESWDDLEERPIPYRCGGDRPGGHPAQAESIRAQLQGQGRRGIQGTRGRTSPCAGGTPGTTGEQDRPCTESPQPKETQRPTVPSLPEGHTPRQSVLLSHQSRVPALQPRGSPANP